MPLLLVSPWADLTLNIWLGIDVPTEDRVSGPIPKQPQTGVFHLKATSKPDAKPLEASLADQVRPIHLFEAHDHNGQTCKVQDSSYAHA